MYPYTGPSGKRYQLDTEGSPDCDVHFTVHTHTSSEVDVSIPMEDILFLAALHIRALHGGEMDGASCLEVLGLKETE